MSSFRSADCIHGQVTSGCARKQSLDPAGAAAATAALRRRAAAGRGRVMDSPFGGPADEARPSVSRDAYEDGSNTLVLMGRRPD